MPSRRKDGEIFLLLHDDNPERTSNGWGVAGELNWQGFIACVDAGGWFSANLKASRCQAAPAGESERCCKHGMMANIEIKTGQRGAKATRTSGVGRPRTVGRILHRRCFSF